VPGSARSSPRANTMRPWAMVWLGMPRTVRPSKMLKSFFENWVLALSVLVPAGSQSTRSASAPSAMTPLRGYMLKSLAALAEVMATNSLGVSRPELTPASHSTAMRSSTPPQPLGILAKLSMPAAFCDAQKVQ